MQILKSHRKEWRQPVLEYMEECIRIFADSTTFETYYNQFMNFMKWCVAEGHYPWLLTLEEMHSFATKWLAKDDV